MGGSGDVRIKTMWLGASEVVTNKTERTACIDASALILLASRALTDGGTLKRVRAPETLNQSHDGIYMVVGAGHVGLTLALV